MTFEELHRHDRRSGAHFCGGTWRPYHEMLCSMCRPKPPRETMLIYPGDEHFSIEYAQFAAADDGKKEKS